MKSDYINFHQELGLDSLKHNKEVVCFVETFISEALDSILLSVTLISGFPDAGGKYYLVKNGKQLECQVVGHALLEGKGTTGIYLAGDILNVISVDEIQGMFLSNLREFYQTKTFKVLLNLTVSKEFNPFFRPNISYPVSIPSAEDVCYGRLLLQKRKFLHRKHRGEITLLCGNHFELNKKRFELQMVNKKIAQCQITEGEACLQSAG